MDLKAKLSGYNMQVTSLKKKGGKHKCEVTWRLRETYMHFWRNHQPSVTMTALETVINTTKHWTFRIRFVFIFVLQDILCS